MAPVLQEFPPWASVEVCWSQRRQRSQSFHSASGTKRNATADKEKGNGFSMWDKSVVWPHKPKTESNKCRNVTIKCCWGYKIGELVKFFSRVHRVNQASQQPASDSISTSNQRVRREVTAADTDIIAVWASQCEHLSEERGLLAQRRPSWLACGGRRDHTHLLAVAVDPSAWADQRHLTPATRGADCIHALGDTTTRLKIF